MSTSKFIPPSRLLFSRRLYTVALLWLLLAGAARAQDFSIGSLSSANATVIEVNSLTGDDRGGIAVSGTHVFLSGDAATARFARGSLSGGTGLGVIRDSLVSDLRTEKVYLLANGTTPVTPKDVSGAVVINRLLELDSATGVPNGTVISLSSTITVPGNNSSTVGIFAGWSRVLIHNGARVYQIALPSGTVSDLGALGVPSRTSSESWAYWGVAETIGGADYLAYVRSSTTIARTKVSDGTVSTIATFANLNDMASFTVVPSLGRWYFHHEGTSQFRSGDETLGFADATMVVPPNPPMITSQPAALTVITTEAASFSVAVNGAQPFSFQWQRDGVDIVGATSATLTLASTVPTDAAAYTVVVTNAFGAVTSSPAILTLEAITADLFKITSLKTNNFLIADPLNQAGDDRGGLVASATRVFLRGDDAVGGFSITNLGGAYRLGTNNGGATNFFQHDSLVSDIRSKKVYLLGNGTTPIGVNAGTATTLMEIDGTNGAVVGAPISLSTSIGLGAGGLYTANVGLFSGWGRVVIHNGTNAYSIDPATGTVTDLGAMARPVRAVSESWAYWGVAEYWGGSVKLVYGRDAQAIVRATVPSGATEVVGAFANLNDMASFTVVPTKSRWYFHMETVNQFTNYNNFGGETLGYADATFIYQPLPATIISQPQSLTVTVGANATFTVAATADSIVSYQWRSNGVALLNETNASLTITNAQLANSGDVFAVTVVDGGSPIVSANATLTVLPNAAPTLVVPAPVTVLEDAGSQTNVVTGITAGAAHESGQTLTITATSGNPSLTGPIAVSYAAGTATLRYTNVANAFGTALITVTVSDNGGVTSGGVDSTAANYLLTVNPVNDAPSAVAATSGVVVLEDAGPVTLLGFLSAISAGPGEMQVLSLSIANNNNALFLAQPAINLASGDLTFTPAANAFGSATVTYILSDDGGTANGGVDKTTNTFTITVTPVNDAPTLTLGVTTLNVLTNAGSLTTNLALATTVGPANEVGTQTITNLSVSNDNAALFSVQPALALNGNLSFTVAGNVVGTAVLSIRAQDNGGTLNGGVNLSPVINVTINVSGPNQAPTFTLATNNVVVAEDSGAASVSAFLTALSAGEVTQTVTNLTTSNNNSNLFSAQPVISGGTLTFTPAPDANGVATVTVRATDDGIAPATGTQTFTITVTALNDAPSFTLPAAEAATFVNPVSVGVFDDPSFVDTAGTANSESDNVQFALTALGVTPATFTDFNLAIGTQRVLLIPELERGDLNAALSVGTKAVIAQFVSTGGVLVVHGTFSSRAADLLNNTFGWAVAGVGVGSGPFDLAAAAAGTSFAEGLASIPANDGTFPFTTASLPVGSKSVYANTANGTTAVGILPHGSGRVVFLAWDWYNGAPVGPQNGGWTNVLKRAIQLDQAGGAQVVVAEDSGAYSTNNFATNLSVGPANESGQTLAFTTSNTASNLFSAQPAISAAGTLTFTPAPNAFGNITVTVTAVDNGGAPGVSNSAPQTFTITITNINDAPAIVFATNNLVVPEDAGAVSSNAFLTLSPGPFNEPGTVTITSVANNNNSLFSVQPAFTGGMLTFTPAANSNGVATVTVIAQDDTLPTGLFSTNSFTITVLPVNDAPTLTLTNLVITVLTNSGGYSGNLGATISVGPPNEASQVPVSFSITNNNNALFSTQPSANQGGSLSFSVAPGVQGTATLYVRVRDTGGTANGGVDVSDPVLVTVNVTPANAAPSFTLGATSITKLEDSGTTTSNLFLTALSPGSQPLDASQTVTLTVVNNNNSLFSAQPALTGSGTTRDLTFTPAANASGVATVTITATDNGAPPLSTVQTVTINVLSVNDAPVITFASANIALENAGAQSLSGFATITTGPAAESSQSITNVSVSNDNNALFSIQPALAANGTLTFTPILNASGIATVTVIAQDNGGTANGGVDKATNTFTIAIAVVNQAPSFNLRLANTQASPIVNGSFETGDFTGWTVSDTANTTPSLLVRADGANLGIFNVVSTDGTKSATHGFGGTSEGIISIGQDVSVPANASAQLTFTYRIAWNTIGSAATSNRVFRVSVQPAGGGTELGGQTLFTAAPNTFGVQASNQSGSLDLTPFAGQTVRLAFVAIVPAGDTANGAFELDNVSVTVNTPDFSVYENSGASSTLNYATNILAGPVNESAQTVAFQVSNNNNALFSSQPAIAANGTLTFTPATDAHGAATVTVVAQDNGGTANGGVDTSAAKTFTITVLPVNSAPRVTVTLANVTVNEDSATYSGSVATITTGPADESSQSITNVVTSNDNNSLFSVQPSVSASGVLTFTLAANKNGSATVTFTAQDDGGTANGGVNQTTRTLTITVTPVNDAPSFALPAGTGTAQLTTVSTLAGSTSGSADGTGGAAQFNSPYAVAADSVGNVYVADYGNHRIRKITPAGVVTTFAGSTAGYADGTGAAAQFNQPFAVAVDGADNVFVGEYGNNRIRKITPGGVVTTPNYTNSAGAAFSFGLPVALTFDGAGNLYTVHSYSGILKITPNGLVTVLAGVAGYSVGYVDATGGAARFDNPLGLAADSAGNVYVSEYGNDISQSHIRKITPAGVVTTLAGSTYGFADGTGAAAQFRWLWGVVVDPSGTVYVADTGNNCIRKITAAGVVTTLSSTAGYVDGALSTAKFANPLGMAMDRSGNIYVADQGNQKIRKIASAVPSFELTVMEDSGPYTTNTFATSISAGPADESAQAVSFTVANNNNPLFSSQPAIAADGTLTFTPAANAFGSATVTVMAVDSGSGTPPDVNTSAAQTFTITVTPVNDQPSVTLAGNVTRNEDSGAYSQSSFATFSAGNASESAQAVLAYTVSNSSNALFSVQPAINTAGTLTFTPAANANGVATVTVSVRDNGGTANSGVDTSAEVTFTITINSVNDAPSFGLNGGVLNTGSGGGGGSGDGLIVGGATYYPAGGATVLVAPDLTYSNSVSSTTAGAAVSIDNGQTGDVLGFNTTLATSYGISGTYNSTTKVLSFTGSVTTAQYQEVLRSVTYNNASGTPTTDRTISFNVGLNTLYNPLNGHFYEYVPTVVTWLAAESAATNRIFQGMRGYLATVTSQAENDFIRTKLLADAWIGGSDDVNYVNRALLALGLPTYADQNAAEAKWYWVTGPEAGRQFSNGNGSPVAVGTNYVNWAGGEPNNSGLEHYAQFYYNNNGKWNDLRSSHTLAYMVEYGGQAGDVTSTLALSGSRTLTYNPVLQVAENSGLNTYSLALTNISAGPADESGQLVDFIVSNNNGTLFTIPPAFAADGTLTFTLAANQFGSATVTVQAHDDGGTANGGVNTSAAKTFTIVINNVNEAPTVALSAATVTALEDTATTVSGFAGVTSFGVNESSQTLLGHVATAANTALFSVQPAINTSGVLTFTPAANANGSTTVTVVSQDSGGTANGGVDKTTNTFTITITPVNDAPSFAINASVTSGVWQGRTALPLARGASVVGVIGTKIYVAGGENAGPQSSLQIYDTVAGTWSAGAPMPGPRYQAAGGVINGKLYVVGGWTHVPPLPNSQVFEYDPGTDSWTTRASLPQLSGSGSAGVISGKLYVTSPANGFSGYVTTFQVFDPVANTWSSLPGATKRANPAGAVAGGKFYLFGGVNEDSPVSLGTAEVFDPVAATWSAVAPMPVPMVAATAVELNGLIYVFGGQNGSGVFLNAVQVYNPVANTWQTLGSPPTARFLGMSAVVDGIIYFTGGYTASGTTALHESLDVAAPTGITVAEDSGAYSGSLATSISAGPADESAQAVDFLVSNDNNAVFSSQPVVAANGALTFTPAVNAFGTATVTVRLHDDGGILNGGVDTSAAQTFTITITPVNDAPSITLATNNVVVLEDSGLNTVGGFTSVTSYGAGDSGQSITNYLVSNSSNALFSVQPAIAANGTLTFTPASNANGTATLTVTAQDNGGTANGGVDTSAAVTFTITITPVNDAPSFSLASTAANNLVNGSFETGDFTGWTLTGNGGTHGADPTDGAVCVHFNSGNSTPNATLSQTFTTIPGRRYTLRFTYGTWTAQGVIQTLLVDVSNSDLATRSATTAQSGSANIEEFTYSFVATGTSSTLTFTDAPANNTTAADGSLDNVRVTLDALSVLEDSGAFSQAGFATSILAGPADESAQMVDFLVSNDNNALFSSQPAIGASGTLTFTPAANAFGSATVTVRAHDDGGILNGGVDTSAAQTFTITVTGVNDGPTVALAGNVTRNEDSGAYAQSSFATVTSFGAGETGQTLLGHVVTSDNTALFSAQPAINPSGVLTFTPALNANGSTTVTVVSQDSGGTANGGVDKTTNTFSITITPVNDAPSFALNGGVLNTGSGGGGSGDGLIVGGATYYPAGGATVLVAPDLTYSNSVSSTTAGAAVSIDNGQTGDVLGFNSTLATSYGISGSYNSTTKVLSFTGTATTAQYQEVLRSVTYNNASGTPTTDRTISFNVGLNTLYNPLNGHFYEYISSGLTWTSAKAAAEARTFQGMQGYLATVTSQAENDFIQTKLQADAWIGASDDVNYVNAALTAIGQATYADQSAVEGRWYWVTGPEKGLQFSQNNGSPVSVNGMFKNWRSGEPNNAGNEHYAEFYVTGGWNDLPNITLPYVVEYGGQAGDVTSTLALSGSRTLTYNPVLQVAENSGLKTYSLAVTNISAGPANEVSQVVSFVVTNNNNALFNVQPAIAANGTLTFTPAGSGSGTATVTVYAQDDGGTANGGVDTAGPRTFTITITPVATRVYLSGATPAGPQGETVVVPIMLDAIGTEAAVGFTLNFDPSKLTFVSAANGADALSSSTSNLRNGSQSENGRVGILITKDTGITFAAGTRELIRITFTVNSAAAVGTTPVTFTDVVTRREVADALANAVPAAFVNGSVTITAATVGTPSNYEGDVAPRPFGSGDGSVTVADTVQISRFAAGLDTAASANGEFQRADCAPLGTKGDGRITVADWLQSQRFAAVLDTPGSVGGPTVQATALFAASVKLPAGTRVVRVAGGNLIAGQANTVSVQLDAQGNEAGISLSLSYDATALSFVSATTTTGGSLIVNSLKAAAGKLGLVLVMPAGSTIAAGTKDIVTLTFNVSGSGATAISVTGDSPVAREVADVNANVLGASFVGGSFNIILPAGLKAAGMERAADGSLRLVVRNSDGAPVTAAQAAKYVVHVTSNLGGAWTVLPNALVVENGALKIVDPAAGGSGLRLYKLVETP